MPDLSVLFDGKKYNAAPITFSYVKTSSLQDFASLQTSFDKKRIRCDCSDTDRAKPIYSLGFTSSKMITLSGEILLSSVKISATIASFRFYILPYNKLSSVLPNCGLCHWALA